MAATADGEYRVLGTRNSNLVPNPFDPRFDPHSAVPPSHTASRHCSSNEPGLVMESHAVKDRDVLHLPYEQHQTRPRKGENPHRGCHQLRQHLPFWPSPTIKMPTSSPVIGTVYACVRCVLMNLPRFDWLDTTNSLGDIRSPSASGWSKQIGCSRLCRTFPRTSTRQPRSSPRSTSEPVERFASRLPPVRQAASSGRGLVTVNGI